ncbi:UNKNOWN [Stylonychia lemnae]|uniref:Uncharacterized protein n=1 Tax=Stylonychia lemnae TaxID=5949 RepID=A0A078AYA6_STYLE|nr:UNKNOWN [Stylonychia lemnae]|eukprot:CDW87116.1 UNKNOWN [Stylonychia lemnae]
MKRDPFTSRLANDQTSFNSKSHYTSLLLIPSTQRNKDFKRGQSIGPIVEQNKLQPPASSQGVGERLAQTLSSFQRPTTGKKSSKHTMNSLSPISINARHLTTFQQRDHSVASLTDSIKNTNNNLKVAKESHNSFIKQFKLLDKQLETLNLQRKEQLVEYEVVKTKLSQLSLYLLQDIDMNRAFSSVRQLESNQINILEQFLSEIQKTCRAQLAFNIQGIGLMDINQVTIQYDKKRAISNQKSAAKSLIAERFYFKESP